MNQVRRDVIERHKRECPLVQAGMRHRQANGVDDPVSKEKQIEIKRTGRVGKGPDTAEIVLDPLESIEQFDWLKLRFQHKHAVQVAGLVCVAHRFGVIERRDGDDLTQAADAPHGFGERGKPVAEVGAEGDDRCFAHTDYPAIGRGSAGGGPMTASVICAARTFGSTSWTRTM